MKKPHRIQEFLQRLTPPTRSNLLNELERLESCGAEIPGSETIVEKLRAEFRNGGQANARAGIPSRYFFAPLEPLLVDGAPEHANSGRLQRGSLAALWAWISRDLLPTMARDYATQITDLIAADKQKEARQAANVFQTKVAKSLENTLRSPETSEQVRAKLATYTMSRTAYDDLTKLVCVLRARDALAKFEKALPANIDKFDDARLAKITQLLDGFGKDNAEDIPFALALVATRLRTSWHLIYLATKAAPSKRATVGRNASRAEPPSAAIQVFNRALSRTALGSRPACLAPASSTARKAFTSRTLPQASMIAPSATAPAVFCPIGPLLAT